MSVRASFFVVMISGLAWACGSNARGSGADPSDDASTLDASQPREDGGFITDGGTQAETDSAAPLDATMTDDPFSALWAGVDQDICDETFVKTKDARADADAARYFIGEFTATGEGWSGKETQLLFATPDWITNGGADCQIVWTVTGTEAKPAASCSSCDRAIAIEATLSLSETTCDEALYEGDETFMVRYNIDLDSDAPVFYFDSGMPFATGFADAEHMGYLSQSRCLYF